MKVLILILGLLAAAPAAAEIVICPKNGRPYDTSHGYYVDVPGTAQYVVPQHRKPKKVLIARPSRPLVRSYKSSRYYVSPSRPASELSNTYVFPGEEHLYNGLHPSLTNTGY